MPYSARPGGLTLLQERFVGEYLKDPSRPSDAFRRAGYSPRGASRRVHKLLRHPIIAERIRTIGDELMSEAKVDAAKVIRAMDAIIDDPDAANRDKVRAGELLLKYGGHLTERRRIEHGTVGGFSALSDDELDAEIKRLSGPADVIDTTATTEH